MRLKDQGEQIPGASIFLPDPVNPLDLVKPSCYWATLGQQDELLSEQLA